MGSLSGYRICEIHLFKLFIITILIVEFLKP